MLDRLRDGPLDVGVLALPVHDDQLHGEVAVRRGLRARRAVAVTRWRRPKRAGRRPRVLLAAQPVLLLDEGHCLRDQALAVCQLADATERRGFRATSLETLRQMVAAGVGVRSCPSSPCSHPSRRPTTIP